MLNKRFLQHRDFGVAVFLFEKEIIDFMFVYNSFEQQCPSLVMCVNPVTSCGCEQSCQVPLTLDGARQFSAFVLEKVVVYLLTYFGTNAYN